MRKLFVLTGIFFLILLISGEVSSNNVTNKIPLNKDTSITKENIPEKEITLTPQNPKQGQTVFVNVKTAKNLEDPYLIWENKKIKLFKQQNDSYRGVIGIEASEKAGTYPVSLYDKTKFLNDKYKISVLPQKFPIQNIVISGGKAGLTATQYELNRIQYAKTTLSNISYWADTPFSSPTTGCIISVYGLNRYHNGKSTGDFHKGVDIKAPQGQPIYTVTGGKVTVAEKFTLHGGTVAVDHGQGLTSIYLHMSKIVVKPGQLLKSGQKVGEVGSTGFATGPHLHWGLYINGIPVNPQDYWIKSVPKC